MIIFEILLGVVMIVLYIIFKIKLLNETQIIYKALYLTGGLVIFTVIWAILWTLNIARYNTIIYYPIVELFK